MMLRLIIQEMKDEKQKRLMLPQIQNDVIGIFSNKKDIADDLQKAQFFTVIADECILSTANSNFKCVCL